MAFDRSAIRNPYLTVMVNGKPSSMAVSKMTDAQILGALKLGANAGALASGWYMDGGSVYKRPAATAPAPSTATPPAPAAPRPSGGLATVPANTPAPKPSMTLAQAEASFKGPKTFKDADGNVRRTKEWTNYLSSNGLLGAAKASTAAASGLAPVPPGTPAPVGATPRPAVTPTNPNPSYNPNIIAPGGIGSAINPAPPKPPQLTPDELFRSFMDGTYRADLRNAQASWRAATDPLTSRRNSLTERRAEYGGGTMYDKLYEDATKKFKYDRYGMSDAMNKRGLFKSGTHDIKYGEMSNQFANNATELDRQYGARALRDIDTQIGSANRNYLDQQLGAAENLIGRTQAGGTQIANDSTNNIMKMLEGFGGQLPFGGSN